MNDAKADAGNSWVFDGLLMFMMNTGSRVFRMRAELEAAGATLTGNVFSSGGERWLPLYEAKLFDPFDHRSASYDGERVRDVQQATKADPLHVIQPRYWVPETEVGERLDNRWDKGWLLAWQDVTDVNTMARTVNFSIIPRVAVGHTAPVFLSTCNPSSIALLPANFSAFVFDYVARQKIGGVHLTYQYLKQLPVLPPDTYSQPCPWAGNLQSEISNLQFILPRVLELTYTAWDLEPFARDCGYDGPPFRWDDQRRSLLRAELDAAFFHLYGISRDDAAYILDTFPIVRRKDIEKYGEYRTKTLILEIYDQLAAATRTGQPYQTRRNPPPGPPQEWQVSRTDSAAAPAESPRWVAPDWPAGADRPANWPPHIHPPRHR